MIKEVVNFFRSLTGADQRASEDRMSRRIAQARGSAIVAASQSTGSGWPGVQSQYDEDAFNKDYLYSFQAVQQRSQDLDVNNPDIGGANRTRTAQVIGAGVTFKFSPHPDEVKLTADQIKTLAAQINRERELHSLLGGFDSTGRGRSESKQQERAVLTMVIYGSCLIHRVGRSDDRARIRGFSIELIPGCRISTPYEKYGDPLISFGIQYSDKQRTRVTGFHVRRVSDSMGNNFVQNFKWDFIPAEDASYLSMTEAAGLDREMPACVRVIRQARNRGEFVESAVEGARAQSDHYVNIKCAPKASPYAAAYDDSKQIFGTNFTRMGNGVKVMYSPHGEEVEFLSSKLPAPDFKGFNDVLDARSARGLVISKSAFTHEVTSSWAGGRMEEQQDQPIILQYRRSFLDAWHRVNEWFIESLWLEDVVKLPGYSAATKCYWTQHRATFPGKPSLNPVDTANAREKNMMLRTLTPQQACEEDGLELRENLRQWAQALKIQLEEEKDAGLDPHTLDILFTGKAITTAAGADIAPPAPEPTKEPVGDPAPKAKPNNRMFMNSLGGVE